MTEIEAQTWLIDNFDVSRETRERLNSLVSFLKLESLSQNLVSATTFDHIWARHIVDSAQLLKMVPAELENTSWIDLGAGAGFPGIVIAILSGHKVTLVESRARRIDYLQRAVGMLDLDNQVNVKGTTLERVETGAYSVISARAFAPLPRLFHLAARFSTNKTLWLLPKGRNAAKEWNETKENWNGNFRIAPSVTDPDSGILTGYLSGKR